MVKSIRADAKYSSPFLAKKKTALLFRANSVNSSVIYCFEKRFPNSLAILLDHQLSQFDSNQKNRIEISNLYKTQLQKTTISSSKNIPILRFPILVDNRELILNEFSKQNIFLGQWYNQPVAPFPLPLKKVEYIIGMCPVAENMCKHIINLPTTVTKKEAMLIIKRCAFLINK